MSEGTTRRLFTKAAALAADYREGIRDRPPHARLTGAELLAGFDLGLPETGEPPLAVLEALQAAAEPGLTAPTGPRFFGWVIGASDPLPVAADMLTSAWGQNAGLAACTPAAAAAEQVAAKWLLQLLGLPADSSVGFVTGGTMANFTCLAAARNAVLARVGWDVESDGLQGAPRVRVLLGEDAHTTVFASLRYLGLGGARATRLPCDAEGRMDPVALEAELAHIAAVEGPAPIIVIAQAGQICTGAFDPFPPIAAACRRHGAWLHVDGAFGLWALAVPGLRGLTAGCEKADSWSTDGHKWLQLPYDSGFAIVRDPEALQRAMSITASYLTPDVLRDPGSTVPELSRRARGFAAWAQLRGLGRQGVEALVSGHCALARALAARLGAVPGVRVVNTVHLNQVIVSFGEGPPAQRNATTRAVIAELQRQGRCLAGGADWRGEWVLRLSVIASPLTGADIATLADAVEAAWRAVQLGPVISS